jgi:phosphoribosyl-ATP pyrophosphohydrolase
MITVNNEDKSIYVTRGDVGAITLVASFADEDYTFKPEDVVRMKVFEKKNCENVVKEFYADKLTEESAEVIIRLDDTKIGEVISKPTDYWYEIELNPDTNPQTVIGYDNEGAKIFRLFPEGGDYKWK